MFDIKRWLLAALKRAEHSKLDFYQLSVELSDRLEKLGSRFRFVLASDIWISSRFEEAEVEVHWKVGHTERYVVCPKHPTLVLGRSRA